MKNKRILIIVAHPDDIEFRYAGSAAKWIQNGCNVEYCIATSGDKGFNRTGKESLSIEKRQNLRETEQLCAAEIVGVKKVHFLKFSDGELEYNKSLRKDIVRLIRIFKTEIKEIIPRIKERSKEYGKQAGLNYAESFRTLELP